jgi:hypothetical protein
MSTRRSGPLAAWTSAWHQGRIGPDEVTDAVTGEDAPHLVAGLPDTTELVALFELNSLWRRLGGPVRVVFPAAGDVRGLPGPGGFRAAALEAGEAVCGPAVGVVPEYIDYSPSSAPPTVLWHAFEIDEPPYDYLPVGEAQYDLSTAIRESASALAAADVPGWTESFGPALRDARRISEYVNLPPGHPPRGVALVAQAERLQAVLDLAAFDPVGGAYDRTGIAARREALRPLEVAVRRALLAGYNAGSDDVADQTN